MHKAFYASGLLYHLKTQQILLHQQNKKNNVLSTWSMMRGQGQKKEDAQKTFQRIIYKLLRVKVNPKHIHPVYDYFHETLQATHYVLYAEVGSIKNFHSSKKGTLSWFTFKQATKLPFRDQTRQDLVVSERVIKAQARSKESEHNLYNVQP
ncbi:MAG: hypothetical protein AAB600_02715 [Patescibacteria group bacterium]